MFSFFKKPKFVTETIINGIDSCWVTITNTETGDVKICHIIFHTSDNADPDTIQQEIRLIKNICWECGHTPKYCSCSMQIRDGI